MLSFDCDIHPFSSEDTGDAGSTKIRRRETTAISDFVGHWDSKNGQVLGIYTPRQLKFTKTPPISHLRALYTIRIRGSIVSLTNEKSTSLLKTISGCFSSNVAVVYRCHN